MYGVERAVKNSTNNNFNFFWQHYKRRGGHLVQVQAETVYRVYCQIMKLLPLIYFVDNAAVAFYFQF